MYLTPRTFFYCLTFVVRFLNIPAGVGASYSFTSSSSEAAILTLPEGAARQDLSNLTQFRRHAIENTIRWYQFVNGTLGCEAPNGSLYLVTGCDKCTTWGIASVACTSETNAISLKFTAARVAEASATYKYSWETHCPATVRIGPELCDGAERLQNQCVFMRGFKLTVREGMAALRGRTKVSSILSEKPGSVFPREKGSNIPFMDDGTRSFSGKSSGKAGSASSKQILHSSHTSLEAYGEDEVIPDEDVLLESVLGDAEVILPNRFINSR
jgi:hypothetical protein